MIQDHYGQVFFLESRCSYKVIANKIKDKLMYNPDILEFRSFFARVNNEEDITTK